MYIAMIIQFTKEYHDTGRYIALYTYVKLSLLNVAPYQAYVEIPLTQFSQTVCNSNLQ